MENLVYLFSCFLSCVIVAGLMFQFMGDRYEKAFRSDERRVGKECRL